jgi:hypothetical protein
MFHELAFLSCTFFVTGAICLGGALFNLPHYNDARVWQEIKYLNVWAASKADFNELNMRLGTVTHDVSDARGRIEFVNKKFQDVADDFYRHLSLNAKKARVRK